MAYGNLSKRRGLLSSLSNADLERLETAAVEKLGAIVDNKADKDDVDKIVQEAAQLVEAAEAAQPLIIKAVFNPEANRNKSNSTSIITRDTEAQNPTVTQAVEAYNSGRRVILRVAGFTEMPNAVDFAAVGTWSPGKSKNLVFYGVAENVFYLVKQRASYFLTTATPLAGEFVINAVIDKNKNVSTDVEYAELENALNAGKQLMLMLTDEANGTTVFGQMSARTEGNITWHLCLGTENYEVSCEEIENYNEETDTYTYDYLWKAELITMATDAELNEVFMEAENAVKEIGLWYGAEDKNGAQDVYLYAETFGYGNRDTKLFRLTRTVTDGSDNIPTSAAVYDAVYNAVGDIEAAADSILAIQNELIGGDSE